MHLYAALRLLVRMLASSWELDGIEVKLNAAEIWLPAHLFGSYAVLAISETGADSSPFQGSFLGHGGANRGCRILYEVLYNPFSLSMLGKLKDEPWYHFFSMFLGG